MALEPLTPRMGAWSPTCCIEPPKLAENTGAGDPVHVGRRPRLSGEWSGGCGLADAKLGHEVELVEEDLFGCDQAVLDPQQ